MRLLPVLDILHGRVVRAHGGRRDEYAPWLSPLTPDADPAQLARHLCTHFHRDEVYVADLDALTGGVPQFEVLAAIADAGLSLWLDVAAASPERLAELCDFERRTRPLAGCILALEAIPSPEDLGRLVACLPTDQVVFSLDLFQGRPWTQAPGWKNLDAAQITQIAWDLGIRRLIALDVSRVGSSSGAGTVELCRQFRALWPDLQLVAGGGIHQADGVRQLLDAGCDRVLVASALHAGRLGVLEVLQNGW